MSENTLVINEIEDRCASLKFTERIVLRFARLSSPSWLVRLITDYDGIMYIYNKTLPMCHILVTSVFI